MKILVLGASGLLGREICLILKENNINYLGTYNTTKIDNGIQLNLKNIESFDNIINEYKPTICIICVVEKSVDICENNWNTIKYINIDIIDIISNICNKKNINCIHFSTDYVFDGFNPPYHPYHKPNPLQNYGISKLISEFRISNNLDRCIIIRVPVLYTDNIKNLEESAVTVIGRKILNRIENFTENNYSIRIPLFIKDLCIFILNIINNIDKYHGIYHFYNNKDKITKYNIAKIIGNYLNKDILNIQPYNNINIISKRPYDTELIDNSYNINDYDITSLNNGIIKCFQKLYHPKIYSSTDNIFLLLDGTLIDSDKLHIKCYNKVLDDLNLNLHIPDNYYELNSIDNFLNENINDKELINIIKYNKNKYLLENHEQINLID